jgi:hypothetical protein
MKWHSHVLWTVSLASMDQCGTVATATVHSLLWQHLGLGFLGYLKRMSLYFRIKHKRQTMGIGQDLRKETDLQVLPARSSRSTTI